MSEQLRKYKLHLTIEMEYEHPEVDDPEFFFEEHNCVNNLLEQLCAEFEDSEGSSSCLDYKVKVKYVGAA